MRHTRIITLNDFDNVCLVEIAGDIDMVNGDQVLAVLTAALDRCPTGVVVDLTETGFFGAAGINALVAAARRARDHGVTMTVVADHSAVVRPLRLTGVDRALDLHPSVPLAMAALRGPRPTESTVDITAPRRGGLVPPVADFAPEAG